ncbi:MAG: FtsQ-type POTRA domain-containing protein [Nitrospinaceae bacterium]|nr:FtsQ-type POTRA domain-containing protein [Nitrospinaceae bacterium]NIR57668.1 FtsQ-type POTRA domain-containing protein [Nitrospinaceae bacterium]NIS88143.1 FtsQ-type POTRA domain-containing protein [Nitrospinaceae bacterium]NIT85010.1 FtsQ-type POTRA domain-containing protein [Nitrospinaceae bacterium]NIU47179.1 FtsQ-type POTRA domain-containing protein [Nitrospinaceae bacterium]
MSYPLTKTKSSRLNWGEVHARQTRKRKNPGKTIKGRKVKNRQTGLLEVLKTWAEWIAKIVLLVIMSYGAYHGYRFVTTSPEFAIARIDFSGNEKVSRGILENLAKPLLGRNIFQLDLRRVTEQFQVHPWIQNVSVARRLPKGIHIQLRERVPFARIQLDKTYLMDHFGVLIVPYQGQKEYRDLPLITGVKVNRVKLGRKIDVEGIVPGLQAMYSMNQLPALHNDPIEKFHMSSPGKLVFTTRNQGLDIYLAVHRIQEGFENLKIILDAIHSDLTGIHYIDLSFKDKVVVKKNRKIPRRGVVHKI